MRKLSHFLRCTAGRSSVPTYYEKHLSEKSKLLFNIYNEKILEFDIENEKKKEKRPVVWADAETLLETVVSKRHIIGNYVVKIMADGGQGFFKICMSVMPENQVDQDNSLGENGEVPVKKRKYNEGGSIGNMSKVTSVHKLIMLCAVPSIKESYDNIKVLFDLTNINNISYKFISDFKLILIINGQQTATSMYPCPYCFVSLKTLKSCQDVEDNEQLQCLEREDEDVVGNIGESDHENLNLKTYGDLRKDYKNFVH